MHPKEIRNRTSEPPAVIDNISLGRFDKNYKVLKWCKYPMWGGKTIAQHISYLNMLKSINVYVT